LVDSGRFADHLRTLCGLDASLAAASDTVFGAAPAHPHRSLSDCAGRRKGAARPYGMGLRPTLPRRRAVGGELVMGSVVNPRVTRIPVAAQ
jgi:hypothetical protein